VLQSLLYVFIFILEVQGEGEAL